MYTIYIITMNTFQVYKLMADCWLWEPDQRPTFADITLRLENMFTTTNPSAQLEFLTTTSVEEGNAG